MNYTEKLYSIYDNKAESCIAGIIRVQNHEVARRHFHDALRNTESPLAQHPEDYDLIYLGIINLTTGALLVTDTEVVASGADWLEASKEK